MASMALEIGRALRRARLARGMTLKQLSVASAGRFKPTSVAGYERGERSISVVRFCELCRLVGVPPDRLLGEILRAARADPDLVIDLTHLERLGPSEGELLSKWRRSVGQGRSKGSPCGPATSKCSRQRPAGGRTSSKRYSVRPIGARSDRILRPNGVRNGY
jgi:transcriptional regulator with XRE-family HTH domain